MNGNCNEQMHHSLLSTTCGKMTIFSYVFNYIWNNSNHENELTVHVPETFYIKKIQ